MRYKHKNIYNDYKDIDPNRPQDRLLLAQKLINRMVIGGNKFRAERLLLKCLALLRKRLNEEPMGALCTIILQACPLVELKTRRVGSVNRQIPVTIHPKRQIFLATKWIVENARNRREKTFEERLAMELIDTLRNRSGTTQKRDSLHKMAEANRAFAHYRW